jgi:diguanylate cyclase (GGDEF)-like protein
MFVKHFFSDSLNILSYNCFVILTFFLITYFVTRYLEKNPFIIGPSTRNYYIYLFYSSLITFVIYYNSIFNQHSLKVFYFIPVMLFSMNFGNLAVFLIAGYSSLNLMVLNYLLGDYSNLDIDIIYIIMFFWLAWLIGQHTKIEREIQNYLKKMAVTDSLTDLPNYAGFQEKYEDWFDLARKSGKLLSLVFMDIDNFKNFNDTYGHQKGDEVLQKVGEFLKKSQDERTFFARYGGDEFVGLLFDYDEKNALEKMRAIKAGLQKKNIFLSTYLEKEQLTFSFGLATFPVQARSKKELLDRADYALYQVKATQKDQIKVYQQAISELAAELEGSELEWFNTARTLLSIINAKDRYTFGHSERVADYCQRFIENLDFSPEEEKTFYYGAFLHDIGKIEIEEDILVKKGRLDEEEWSKVKRHTETGARILTPLKAFRDIISMVLYHHENYDGSGYPEGLKGEEIPRLARMLRIIDSYDAITSERPYSSPMKKDEAIAELKKGSGIYYDPELVNVFIKALEQEEASLKT